MLFFPAPPVPPRVQFVAWASGAEQIEEERSALADFVLGDEPRLAGVIQKPYGIAVAGGVAYVCDTKGLAISRMDFVNKTYTTFGVSGPGRLRKPLNIAIDPAGYKFVVDSVRKQVVVFGPDDSYVTAFDVPRPCRPVDIAVHGESLYVLDNDEDCAIIEMDRVTGEVLGTIGGPGGEPGQFKIPNSIAVDDEGFIYVSDTHNWRIQKLSPDGEPVWVRGEPGYRIGQFGRPRGIRVAPDGIIYVVDGATEIVQMFNKEGETLMRFGGPGNSPGALGLPSTVAIDKSSIPAFRDKIHKDFQVEYLLFVASQYGQRLVNVYAFGQFPDGYKLNEQTIQRLDAVPMDEGIGPVDGDDMDRIPAVRNPHESPGEPEAAEATGEAS